MKKNNLYNLGVLLFIGGLISAGLFSIANSIDLLATTNALVGGKSSPSSLPIAGIILFVCLVMAAIGLGITISQTVKANKDQPE